MQMVENTIDASCVSSFKTGCVAFLLGFVQNPRTHAAVINVGRPLLFLPSQTCSHGLLDTLHVEAPPKIVLLKHHDLCLGCYLGMVYPEVKINEQIALNLKPKTKDRTPNHQCCSENVLPKPCGSFRRLVELVTFGTKQ